MKRFQQLGIGLLELMLSLAIIAILLIMATRYYQTTKQAQEVNDAVSLVNSVISAMTNYRTDHPKDYKTASIDLDALTQDGYLPSSLGAAAVASPWRTAVNGLKFGAQNEVFVTIKEVPSGACNQLAGRLKESCLNTASNCGCGTASGGVADYTGNFGTSAN